MQRLGKPDEVAEGRFFPDTYRYTRGMRDIDILRKAYQRMQTILAKEWDGRSQDLPYRDAYQALIMASLVERKPACRKSVRRSPASSSAACSAACCCRPIRR